MRARIGTPSFFVALEKVLKILAVLKVVIVVVIVVAAAMLALVFVVTQPLASAVQTTPPPVDPARLEAHVKALAVDFAPRDYRHFDNLARTVDYVTQQMKATGASVTTQDIIVSGQTYQNVIAHYGPVDGPLMVIGAHYDAVTTTPGADDNASGVAGLIELGRLLGQTKPSRAIDVVAYAWEENPRSSNADMGSAWHAKSLRAANREVSLMLSLEMIGYFTDMPASQRFPAPGLSMLYPEQGNFIALVGRLGDFGVMRSTKAAMSGAGSGTRALPVHSINSPRKVPGIENSDHVNFWDAGYPAMMVTDTAYLRNRNYHKPGDTWDTLDYKRMAQVVQAVWAVCMSR